MIVITLAFLTSFFIVLLVTPILIRVAILKRLFDAPGDNRKLHTRMVPTIGGVIIFAATLFAFSLWFPNRKLHETVEIVKAIEDYKFIVATLLVMFFIGIKDDIIGTAPVKKLIAHVLVALVLVLMGDIRIVSLHGIFGVQDIPYWASIFLSLFTFIVVVNAFNLIDGIDGLAGGVGLIAATSFGFWFLLAGDLVMASLAFSLSGALVGFLFFNFAPAKIFMGDSGSLTIGLIICILAIKIIGYDVSTIKDTGLLLVSKPIFVMSVLVYPLLDTLRIFVYRAVRGLSPFSADRNHLHHRLMDLFGQNHAKVVLIIYLLNIFIIIIPVFFYYLESTYLLLLVGGSSLILTQIPYLINKRKSHDDKKE